MQARPRLTSRAAVQPVPLLILPTGQAWPIVGEGLSIGHQVGNDLLLDDSNIAAEHLKIARINTRYVALDLGSAAGVLVNGERIRRRRRLRDGDRIGIGNSCFIFQWATIDRPRNVHYRDHQSGFVFADATGRRWRWICLMSALALLLVLAVSGIYLQFLLQ